MSEQASNKNLSHTDIWDDSALVNSWNDAVEEYKYYHSLYARGEKIEDVLAAADAAGNEYQVDVTSNPLPVNGNNKVPEEVANETVEKMEEDEIPNSDAAGLDGTDLQGQGSKSQNKLLQRDPVSKTKPGEGEGEVGGTSSAAAAVPGPPAIPQHLIGTVQDEGLKSLLMSWYYAGYYTGLYEGKAHHAPTGG